MFFLPFLFQLHDNLECNVIHMAPPNLPPFTTCDATTAPICPTSCETSVFFGPCFVLLFLLKFYLVLTEPNGSSQPIFLFQNFLFVFAFDLCFFLCRLTLFCAEIAFCSDFESGVSVFSKTIHLLLFFGLGFRFEFSFLSVSLFPRLFIVMLMIFSRSITFERNERLSSHVNSSNLNNLQLKI